MFHELVSYEKVTGAIEDGTVSDVTGKVTVRCTLSELTTELPGIDGSGAEVTVTAFPHSFLHISLDGGLQVTGLAILHKHPHLHNDLLKFTHATQIPFGNW